MMKRPLVAIGLLAAVSILASVAAAAARDGKRASPRELLRLGFFQDFEELDLEALLDASDVLLTVAGRGEQSPEKAPGAVTVVTSEDIQATGARTLYEVLRTIPGVDVQTDGLGHPRVVMRGIASGLTGGGSENVAILMNGHRIDDALFGGSSITDPLIPVENIKKIEVLRGPSSALFGSGAVAGVIAIVTFTHQDFLGIAASVEAGSFGTQRYTLTLGSESKSPDGVKMFGFVSFEDTNGARLPVPADAQSRLEAGSARPVSLAPGRTTDALRSVETNYHVSWRDVELDVRVGSLSADGFVGMADALGQGNDLRRRHFLVGATHKRAVGHDATLRLSATFSQNEVDQVLHAFPPGFSRPFDGGTVIFPGGVVVQEDLGSRRLGVDALVERPLGEEHQLTAGIGLARESAVGLAASANYDFRTGLPLSAFGPIPGSIEDRGRTVASALVQDGWSPSPRFALTGGLRLDHYGDVGGFLSPRLAAVVGLHPDLHLKLLYGRAFRAPTFAERDLDLPGYLGNAGLEPQRVDAVEASLAYRRNTFRASVSAYASLLRDAIAPGGAFTPLLSRPIVNGAGADLRGFELELRGGFGMRNLLFASYAYQDAEDRGRETDAALVPAHLGRLGATFAIGSRVHATALWTFRSTLPREPGDPRRRVASYGELGLTLRAVQLWRTLGLTVVAHDLLDRRHRDPARGVPGDYPRPGRAVYVSAAYQF